jgi:hypothetical protein
MIDNFTLLTVTGVIVFLIYQAARLDRTRPWFGGEAKSDQPVGWRKAAMRQQPTWRQRPAAVPRDPPPPHRPQTRG